MRRWEWGLAALLEIVAVLGVLVLAWRWCANQGWQWDLTPDTRYTLPAEARTLLRSLDEPLRLIAFLRSGVRDPAGLSLWLPLLAQESHWIQLEFVDVDREPTRARRYGIQSAPTVVVESSRRQRIVYQPQPAVLLSHIAAAVRTTVSQLRMISSRATAKQDYSRAFAALQNEGFAVVWADGVDDSRLEEGQPEPDQFVGNEGAVPEDRELAFPPASLGNTVGERVKLSRSIGLFFDPSDANLSTLQAFLGDGGGALLAVEPTTCARAARLCAWLREHLGIELGSLAIVDARTRLAAGDPYTILATGLAADHPITAALHQPVLVSEATTVELTDPVADSAWLLLSAAPSARLEKDTRSREHSHERRQPPFPLAVARYTATRGRLVVVADADFATDRFLDYVGNRDFLLNVANWLADEHTWLGPRVAPRMPGVQVFYLSAAQAERLLWGFAVAEPAALLVLGLLVWWRRRS